MTDLELRLWARKFGLTEHELAMLKIDIERKRDKR